MQAVGGAGVLGAGGDLPPGHGALGVVGEVEDAGEDMDAVDVDGQPLGEVVRSGSAGAGQSPTAGSASMLTQS